MLASRLLVAATRAARMGAVPVRCRSTRDLIGAREIVGYGFNGEPTYADRTDFPMPAIRWKEPTPDIIVSLIELCYVIYIISNMRRLILSYKSTLTLLLGKI